MQVRRSRQGPTRRERVVKVNDIRKLDGPERDAATLELYLTVAHASARGSLRSEPTEFLPTFFRRKNAPCYFSARPTTAEGSTQP